MCSAQAPRSNIQTYKACYCLMIIRHGAQVRISPGSCQSKVYSFTQTSGLRSCSTCCCCCCTEWDAVLGAVGRALILSSLVNSRSDAHLRCLAQCVLHDAPSLCHVGLFFTDTLDCDAASRILLISAPCLCCCTSGQSLNYSLCSLTHAVWFSRGSWIQVGRKIRVKPFEVFCCCL